jgi:hypothetical protein
MNPPDPAKLFAESAERFTKFWNDFSANSGGLDSMEVPTPDSMRKMRDAFLKNLSKSYDEYLRSQDFTSQLSQMLQQGVRAQQRMSEMMGQARSSVQEASRQDVDAIMEVMQRLERRISDGFERMDERISALEPKAGAPSKPARKVAKKRPVAKKAARTSKTAKAKKTRKT